MNPHNTWSRRAVKRRDEKVKRKVPLDNRKGKMWTPKTRKGQQGQSQEDQQERENHNRREEMLQGLLRVRVERWRERRRQTERQTTNEVRLRRIQGLGNRSSPPRPRFNPEDNTDTRLVELRLDLLPRLEFEYTRLGNLDVEQTVMYRRQYNRMAMGVCLRCFLLLTREWIALKRLEEPASLQEMLDFTRSRQRTRRFQIFHDIPVREPMRFPYLALRRIAQLLNTTNIQRLNGSTPTAPNTNSETTTT